MLAYNHEHYISVALDSVFDGPRIPDQVIVVDDYSTDSTVEILRDYQKKHPRILEIIENDSNLGIFDNLNKIYDIPVKGNVVSFLAGDDVYDRSLLAEIDFELLKCSFDPHVDMFMTLPNVANLFMDGSTQNLDNSIIDSLKGVTPFQIALRSRLYSMHVGISIALYRNWARFPRNAMTDIGIFADLPHYLRNIKTCSFFIPIYSATTYHRVGVGVTSRSQRLSPQESRYRAMKLISKEFVTDLSFSDCLYLKYSMAIDSIYISKNFLGLFKVITLLPLALLVDGIDKFYYINSVLKLSVDICKKIKNLFCSL